MTDPIAKAAGVPPPPQKPDPLDCCGGGCMPCILDFYEDELEAWREQYGEKYDAMRKQLAAHAKANQ